MFYSSSSEVYGEPYEIPQNEETTPLKCPPSLCRGKANRGNVFSNLFTGSTIWIIPSSGFFNTYGPRQSEDFVVPKFLNAALKGEDITIYGDGSQTRTFCYIEDNLDSTLKILYDDLCVNDVINLGSDEEMTILELAELIIDTAGSSSKIVHLPALKEGDMRRRCPDNTKMRNLMDRDLISLKDGIRKMIAYYQNAQTVKA